MTDMSEEEFVARAHFVAESHDGIYADGIIMIRLNRNGLDLEVTRQPMPDRGDHLTGSNPTTMVSNGEIIRHHGEAVHLEAHLLHLSKGYEE